VSANRRRDLTLWRTKVQDTKSGRDLRLKKLKAQNCSIKQWYPINFKILCFQIHGAHTHLIAQCIYYEKAVTAVSKGTNCMYAV